ncbi:MAG: DUF3078 domain-containing protein [Bacteroidales bacterium]|nr:DUF3078 domain-containing protein [Bacteroidales bacterium]
MKNNLIILFLIIPFVGWSQDPEPKRWEYTGITGLNLNQASFTNWSVGGVNSVAFSALGKFTANHKKDKFSWNNNLNLIYGMVKNEGEDMRKSEDLLELITVPGYDLSKHWSLTGYVSFKTQFTNTYDLSEDPQLISAFLAPAYLTISPSLRYSPVEWFYLLLSPATAKFTFVMDQELADKGSFGVTPAEYNENEVKVKDGENTLIYLGPFVEAYLKKELAKGFTFESRLNFLYTLINRENLEPTDMDINWENFLNYQLAKYFSVSAFVHMAYLPGQSNLLQVKQTFGIGLTYSFPVEK